MLLSQDVVQKSVNSWQHFQALEEAWKNFIPKKSTRKPYKMLFFVILAIKRMVGVKNHILKHIGNLQSFIPDGRHMFKKRKR